MPFLPFDSLYGTFIFTGGSKVTAQSEQSLQIVATLMSLDKEELRDALTSRVMQATRGGIKGTVIK